MQTTLDIPENLYPIAEKTTVQENDPYLWTSGGPLIPEYAALIASRNFPVTPDSTPGISDDRDDR